ncbi:MAG: N-6 DNA methylase [Acetobacteraceae bacterium]
MTTSQLQTLQTRTFYGKEKKSLAYVIATMNMILHGIEAPNIVHTNTLAENLDDVQEKDRFDVILANPAVRWEGAAGGAAELPDQDWGDGVPVPAAISSST